MKKFLLSAAAVFAALSMNAQEVCTFNADNALELDADNGTALAAGTVIGETESIVATIGADDTYKPQSAKFTVNGTEIAGGLQGGTNPKDADGGTPATTLVEPASGAYLVFEAKADGYLYVMHKASSNKAYSVFEEGTAISYTFAAIGDAATDLGAVYEFTLPYEEENEQYAIKESIGWAEQEYLKINDPEKYAAPQTTGDDGTVSWTAIKVNGLGVIAFPVYKIASTSSMPMVLSSRPLVSYSAQRTMLLFLLTVLLSILEKVQLLLKWPHGLLQVALT